MTARIEPPPQVDWEAEGLRFSALAAPSAPFTAAPLWKQLVGTDPEEATERPQVGLRQESGPLGDATLFVTQQPMRVDIILGVHPNKVAADVNEGVAAALVSIGSYSTGWPAFEAIVSKWLKIAPVAGRLAYAPVILSKTPDRKSSYELLAKFLHYVDVDSENSEGMLWQINRPRPSTVVPEERINRLTKWTGIRFQQKQIVGLSENSQDVRVLPISVEQAARVEIDINTVGPGPLPSDRFAEVFQELWHMADEIMKMGDVP